MKLIFCGTPEFAVPTLQALLEAGHEVGLVLSQPDRPAGRKMELQMPAVKSFALARGLDVLQPEKIKNNLELRATLEKLKPDTIVVVAYGRIIPAWMLELPRLGCLNGHGSLLPKYRGAAPIQWAIADGERQTGVTTMRLDAGLDTGPMLLERAVPVGEDATSVDMYPILATVAADLMVETLAELASGTLTERAQDEAQATLAPILKREDGRLDLARTARQTYDRWRGFSPWPGCWGEFRGKRFLLTQVRVSEAQLLEAPKSGSLVLHAGKLLMAAAEGTLLELLEVQMEGKARLAGAAFWKDFQVKAGERVG